jgi:MFS family permease
MPIFIAPIAGALSDRIGGHRLMAAGLALQAVGLIWIAAVSSITTPYVDLVAPFFLSGIGMSLFFAPVANVVLSSVSPEHEGKASGATNAIRELGGVFGVAVLASVFAHAGGYRSPATFVHGLTTAVYIGGGLVAAGAVAAALIEQRRREPQAAPVTPRYFLGSRMAPCGLSRSFSFSLSLSRGSLEGAPRSLARAAG